MKHKAHILLIGITANKEIASIPGLQISNCSSVKDIPEMVMGNQYDIIISNFQIENTTAIEINQILESIKSYTEESNSKFKYLVLSSSNEEEKRCKANNLLFFPSTMRLRLLILQLIDIPKTRVRPNKQLAIIDFQELFVRVDNNRAFIKTVIEKFFEVKDSRISDIKNPLQSADFNKAKDAAHKLKGVLANFSMLEARNTIIELEKLILREDQKLALEKLEELIGQIEKAKHYYEENIHEFQ
jgi:HPt (histidine-containing phosphotransfer) domain-containing protein